MVRSDDLDRIFFNHEIRGWRHCANLHSELSHWAEMPLNWGDIRGPVFLNIDALPARLARRGHQVTSPLDRRGGPSVNIALYPVDVMAAGY